LQSTLHSRVPLFKQLLPLGGNLADRVSEALQAMLGEKHLPGRVSYLRESQGESGGALVGIAYRVEEVGIRIQSVEFPGASPEHAAFLTAAAHQLIGMAYSRPALAAVAKFDLLPVYLQRGYLKAEFEPSNARVVSQSPTDPDAPASDPKGPVDRQAEVEVVAAIPVTPGKMYSSSGVDWKGDSAIATADLVPILHLPPGEPVDAVRLLRDIDNVGKLYRSRGYMMIQVKDDARFDDEKATVHYDINIVEGDLYKMGELEITGLDTQSKARMEAAWTLHEGQNYNADYPKKYRDDIGPLLPRGVRWAIIIHETPDARDKTVDVEIHFKQQ
jgi:outer membrane protein assembly factor BamA